MERIDRAPTRALLLAAIYRWLYPRLIALYRAHLRDTDPVMHVIGGSPTPEERAAVEAVLIGMADEWAETKHRTVLDAESEIFNAQINYAAASYDERVAVYQVLLAMGRLNADNLSLASAQ